MSPRGRAATQRGSAAEREVARLIGDATGWRVRRKLGAGRKDDQGDLDGVPDCTVQVVCRTSTTDLATAMRTKPAQCESQQARAGTRYGVTLARVVPGLWLALLTSQQARDYGHRSCICHAARTEWNGLYLFTFSEWIDIHREAVADLASGWAAS